MQFPNINPTAFEIFGISIKWYGISYAIGLFLALAFSKKICKVYNTYNYKVFDDIIIWLALGIIIGGRLGYVLFYDLSFFIKNYDLILLGIRDGGMSFHGGILGLTFACYIYTKIKNIKFLGLMDLISCSAPIGLFLGRIANFINSELWGKKTDFFLGVTFPNGGNSPRHPSQLYEAFLEGIILFIVLNYIYKKKHSIPGFTASAFLIFYSVFRVIGEYFREPDSQIGYLIEPYLTMGMFLCIPMAILGISLLTYYVKHHKNSKK